LNAGNSEGRNQAAERRLFFALWPDATLRDQLDRAIVSALPPRAGRPIPLENLHITLVFLGQVAESRIACIEQAAARPRATRFELVLDRIAWWRQSQVLWLGPCETPAALEVFVSALRDELRACDLSLETRPFRAHMTLMRKVRRRPQPVHFTPLVWRPDGLALIESMPVDGGVRYQRRAFWPFA
jgi:RNA 2',3'-cyclic 3'-phosphodiesterase